MNEREFFAELASRITAPLSPDWCEAVADRINNERLTSQFGFPAAVVVLQTTFDAIIDAWDEGRGDKQRSLAVTARYEGPIRTLLNALAIGDLAQINEATGDLARTILARP